MKFRLIPGKFIIPWKNLNPIKESQKTPVLKTGILFLFLMMFLLPLTAKSEKFNFLKEDIMLTEALHRLSQKYEVFFSYDEKMVKNVEVSYEADGYESINHALDQLLAGTALEYKVFDNRYIILYEENKEAISSLRGMVRHLETVIDSQEQAAPIRNKGRSVALLKHSIANKIAPIAFSVSGMVTDQEGEPLIGVNIQVKGTNKGTATDFDGRFTLDDIDENAVLVVSYIGYQTQEVSVAGKRNLDIMLVSDSQLLDEVVVVGYGMQKKTSLTSAVSSIAGKEINSIPVTNLSNAMGGRLSGVVVKQASGEPGRDGSNIYIRGISTIGSKQPLLIVDGIPRNFQNLDPNSIESFTVLKDAAAVAPYGVAGANGVILVTTKEGESGAPVISYNGYVGFQNPTILPDFVNGYEFATLKNLAAENVGLPRQYSDEALQKFKDGSDPDRYPPLNDVWGELSNKNALLNYHSIGVSGGSNDFNYYVNFGYQNQEGMWATANSSRYNFLISLDGKITSTTNLSVKLNGIIKNSAHPPSKDFGSFDQSNNSLFAAIKYAHPERGPLYYSNGLPGYTVGNIFGSGSRDLNSNSIYSQVTIKQKLPFITGLNLTGTIAYDPTNGSHKIWSTPIRIGVLNTSKEPAVIEEVISGKETATLIQQENISQHLTYQAGLNYDNKFGRHGLGFIGVFEAINQNSRIIGASRKNYRLSIDEINMGSSSNDDMTTEGSSSESSQVGLVYRLSYDYDSKYLVEASGRYDGHYYFAPDNRFGFFPAFSVGWRVSEEPFMNNVNWLDNLKIRASYGEVGALAGGPFQYLSTYGVRGPGYSIGGSGVQVVYERPESNPNITWERAEKTDIGIELSAWNGFINFEADYFHENRSNMLVSPNVITPLEYGVGLSQVNDGVMENRGFEFLAGLNKKFSNDLLLRISGTLTFAKNKVLEIYESGTTYDNPNRRRTGRPLGTQFGYKEIGYFTEVDFDQEGNLNSGIAHQPWGKVFPGDLRYQDTNGDGKIDPNDRVPIGNPSTPGIIYGFSPNIEYKNISFQLLFQGVSNANQYLNQSATWAFFNARGAYVQNFDYWKNDNQNARFPRLTPVPVDNNTQTSSKWTYDVSYLRIKDAKLSYNLPSSVTQKINMNNIQIYLSGQNILTWTGYIGEFYDPESINSGGYVYPHQKVYSVGLQISL